MTNELKTFDADQWLATQKKGFGGKVSREVFIAKLKELGTEIEQLKKDKTAWETKNKNLEEKLATAQSNIQEKEKIIAQNWTDLDSQIANLQQKITEQEKILQDKDQELNNLQQRPNITDEKYQELLNNQEKHQPEEIKPANLPDDWEKQLSDKKIIEKNFADTEKKYSTMEEKMSANQKKFLEIEAKLIEAEKRPASEELEKTIQQEINYFFTVRN